MIKNKIINSVMIVMIAFTMGFTTVQNISNTSNINLVAQEIEKVTETNLEVKTDDIENEALTESKIETTKELDAKQSAIDQDLEIVDITLENGEEAIGVSGLTIENNLDDLQLIDTDTITLKSGREVTVNFNKAKDSEGNYTIAHYEIINGDGLSAEEDREIRNYLDLLPKAKWQGGISQISWGSVTEVQLNGTSVNNGVMNTPWSYYFDPQSKVIIFCIQPGVIVSGNYVVGAGQSNDTWNSMAIKDKINMVHTIEAGMRVYKEVGGQFDSNAEYLSTIQVMIWDLRGHNADNSISPQSAKDKYNEIKGKINSMKTSKGIVPSFSVNTNNDGSFNTIITHDLNWNPATNRYEKLLTDSNGMWDSRYSFYGSFGDYKLENGPGANTVLVSTTNHNAAPLEFKPSGDRLKFVMNPYQHGGYDIQNSAVSGTNGQDMISSGAGGDPTYAKFGVKIVPAPVKLYVSKVDSESGAEVPGAEICITNTATGAENCFTSTDKPTLVELLPGTYEVCETLAPPGYVINTECDTVTVTPGDEDIDLEIINKPIKGGFELSKVGDTGLLYPLVPNVPLENVEFTLTGDTLYGPFTRVYKTDADGKIITTNDELFYGDYKLCETKTIIGYVNPENCYEFKIDVDGEIEQINNIDSIINKAITGSVELTKLGLNLDNPNFENCGNNVLPEDCESWQYKPLEGAEFSLYWLSQDGNNNGLDDEEAALGVYTPEFDTDLDQDGINDAILIDVLTTDITGYIKLDNLKYGKYIIRETKAPVGYVNTGFEETFFIENDGDLVTIAGGIDYAGDECLDGVCNDILLGQADLVKIGDYAYTSEGILINPRLEGAKFLLYEDRGEVGVLDSKDIPLQTITSDEMGYAITNKLRYGDYLLEEIQAPPGYEISQKVYPFKISENDKIEHINAGKPIINIADVPVCGDPNYPEMPNNPEFPACNPEIEAEKSVVDYNGDGVVQAGEQLTYTISVKNKGLGFAKNVNVQDDVITQLEKFVDFDSETLNQVLEIETIAIDRPQNQLPIQVDPKPTENYVNVQDRTKYTLLDLVDGDVYVDVPSYMEANISFTVRAKDPLPDRGSNNGSLVCGELGNVAWITEDPTPTDPTDPIPEEPNHKPEVEIPVECRDPEVETRKLNEDESGNGILESGEKVKYYIEVRNISDVFAGGVIVGDDVKDQLGTNFDLNEETMNQELVITTVIEDQERYDDYILAEDDFTVSDEVDPMLPIGEKELIQNTTTYTLNDLQNNQVIIDVPVGHIVSIGFEVTAKSPIVDTCSQIINIATVDPTPNNPDDEMHKPESEIPTFCNPGEITDTGLTSFILYGCILVVVVSLFIYKNKGKVSKK